MGFIAEYDGTYDAGQAAAGDRIQTGRSGKSG